MKTQNPNHNLWLNNGIYWCRFTVHNLDYTKARIAKPLRTRDLAEARRLRDKIMKSTPGAVLPEVEFLPLSAMHDMRMAEAA